MSKIILSYTTLNNYHISPHSYLNKNLGIQTITTPAMQSGKDAHKLIQDHCTGVKKDDRLKDFSWKFTKAEHHAMMPYNDKYTLHGYIDMIGFDNKVIAEIKTGSPWSQQRFHDSEQWRYYSMVTGFRKVLLITCRFDLSEFKTYYAEVEDEDIVHAKKWTDEAITGIDAGIFKTDLDENGVCVNPKCPYQEACYFKI